MLVPRTNIQALVVPHYFWPTQPKLKVDLDTHNPNAILNSITYAPPRQRRLHHHRSSGHSSMRAAVMTPHHGSS